MEGPSPASLIITLLVGGSEPPPKPLLLKPLTVEGFWNVKSALACSDF